jgi:hypothetical protein
MVALGKVAGVQVMRKGAPAHHAGTDQVIERNAQRRDHPGDHAALAIWADVAHAQGRRGLLAGAGAGKALGLDGPGLVFLALPPDRIRLRVAVKAPDLVAQLGQSSSKSCTSLPGSRPWMSAVIMGERPP